MIILVSAPLASIADRESGAANSTKYRPTNTNLASRCEGLKSSLRLFARTLATRAIATEDYSIDLIAMDDKAQRLFADQVQRELPNFDSVSSMLEAKNVLALVSVDGGEPEAVFDSIECLLDAYLNVDGVWARAVRTSSDVLISKYLSHESLGGYNTTALGGVPPASIVTSSSDSVVLIEDPDLRAEVEGIVSPHAAPCAVAVGDVVDAPEVELPAPEEVAEVVGVDQQLDIDDIAELLPYTEELYVAIQRVAPEVNEINTLFSNAKRLHMYMLMPAATRNLSIDAQSMLPLLLESVDALAAHYAENMISVNSSNNIDEHKEPTTMSNITDLMRVCQEMYAEIKKITPALPPVTTLFAASARIKRYLNFAPAINALSEADRALLPKVAANAELVADGFVELGNLMAEDTHAEDPAVAVVEQSAVVETSVAAVVVDEDEDEDEDEADGADYEEEAEDAEAYARKRWPVLSTLLIDGAYQDLPPEDTSGLAEVLADAASQMVGLFADMDFNAPFDADEIEEVMEDGGNQLAAIVGLLLGSSTDFDPLNSGSGDVESVLDAAEESAAVMQAALLLDDEDEDEDEEVTVDASLFAAFSELGDDLYRVAELLIPGCSDAGITAEELAVAFAEMCDHHPETACQTLDALHRSLEEDDAELAAIVWGLANYLGEAHAIEICDADEDDEDEDEDEDEDDEMGLDGDDDEEDESDDLRLVNVSIVPRLVLNLSLDNRLRLTEDEILALGSVEGEDGTYDLGIGLNGRSKRKSSADASRGFYLDPIRDTVNELSKLANASVLIPQSKLKGDHERLARAVVAALPNGAGGLNTNLRGDDRIYLDNEGNITVGFASEDGDEERVVNFNDLCSLSTHYYVSDNIATGTTIEITTVMTMFLPRLAGGSQDGRSRLVAHLCKLAARNSARTGVTILPAITFLGADLGLQDTSHMTVPACVSTMIELTDNADAEFGNWAGAVGASLSSVMSGEDHGMSYLASDSRIDFDDPADEDEIVLVDSVLPDAGAVMMTDAGPSMFTLGGDYTIMLVPATASSDEEMAAE